jgi:hypothetical protein
MGRLQYKRRAGRRMAVGRYVDGKSAPRIRQADAHPAEFPADSVEHLSARRAAAGRIGRTNVQCDR